MGQEAERERKLKEMTMNALNTLSRNVTCFAAALVICAICGNAFVESTATVRGAQPEVTTLAHAASPSWFGRPQPAVLVD
ncbi:MAG TPA: hypothetical protein VKT54_02155 [Steroidobacteraceae bacterium]|nr:hypothetical protein [Steroidobacteraceae bacterium]